MYHLMAFHYMLQLTQYNVEARCSVGVVRNNALGKSQFTAANNEAGVIEASHKHKP